MVNMKFLSTLLVDEKSNKVLTKKRLVSLKEKKLYKLPLICIYFAAQGARPEFTDIKNLNFPYFHRNEPIVLGFAESEKDAIGIVKRFVKDVYAYDTELNYRKYIEQYEIAEVFSRIKKYEIVDDEEISAEFKEVLKAEENNNSPKEDS